MNSHEEEEDDGPSVDSEIAEERIAARRLRIQRRLEAARRYFFKNFIVYTTTDSTVCSNYY